MKHRNIEELPRKHKTGAEGYEFYRRDLMAVHEARSLVRVYELPPGKSAYPYHYHLKDVETFHILSGGGLLRTPEGEKPVTAGDFLHFPAGPAGAHKLTNTGTEPLVYIDFDVIHDLDVCFYPDSGKLAVWGKDVNRVYPLDANVDYYEGE